MEFTLIDDFRDGATDFFEAWEIPQVGKISALFWFDGLHRAISALQKNALAVGFVLKGESAPVVSQAGEGLDESKFAHAFECREARDFRVRQPNLPRPPATGRATLAFVKYRHGGSRAIAGLKTAGCRLHSR
jgi:hypothetical protein